MTGPIFLWCAKHGAERHPTDDLEVISVTIEEAEAPA
jgi:hypothetical protein